MRSTVTSTFAKIIAIIEDENLTKEGREKKRDVYDMMGMLQKRVSRNENLWHFYLWHFASSEQPQLRRKTPRDLFHNWSPFINTRIFIVNFIFGVYNKHFWSKNIYIYIRVLLQTKQYSKSFRLFTIWCETRVVK